MIVLVGRQALRVSPSRSASPLSLALSSWSSRLSALPRQSLRTLATKSTIEAPLLRSRPTRHEIRDPELGCGRRSLVSSAAPCGRRSLVSSAPHCSSSSSSSNNNSSTSQTRNGRSSAIYSRDSTTAGHRGNHVVPSPVLTSDISRASFSSKARGFDGSKPSSRLVRVVGNMQRREAEAAEPIYAPQRFTNLLVVDFEATCNRHGPKPDPQEIIEFPVLNIGTKDFKEISRFHSYVQPDVHKELTEFCAELTGIIQAMVDDQPSLVEVLRSLEQWLKDNSLTETNCAVVTYGDWDIQSALARQCAYLNVEVPSVFRRWINLKKAVHQHWGRWPAGLHATVRQAGLTPSGRAHSGIDDCLNIAQLVRHLAQNGYQFHFTGSLQPKSQN